MVYRTEKYVTNIGVAISTTGAGIGINCRLQRILGDDGDDNYIFPSWVILLGSNDFNGLVK